MRIDDGYLAWSPHVAHRSIQSLVNATFLTYLIAAHISQLVLTTYWLPCLQFRSRTSTNQQGHS